MPGLLITAFMFNPMTCDRPPVQVGYAVLTFRAAHRSSPVQVMVTSCRRHLRQELGNVRCWDVHDLATALPVEPHPKARLRMVLQILARY